MNPLNNIGKKQSFKSILDIYDRIEIPIIQRDYAQGRTGKRETNVRNGILNHILYALAKGQNAELDFIYGVERQYTNSNGLLCTALIPIDGQQRLTTLWLIHWFLACKAGILNAPQNTAKEMLSRFTYETRVSSKDFLNALCNNKVNPTQNIKAEIIEDAIWFEETWKLDPSVMGFLTMLDAIANHEVIKNNDPKILYNRLIAEEPAVSFYFLPLEKFGLGEEIYTRMNARGKILTDFEVFKSNFFKIIDDSPMKDEFAKKIEYDWVYNLWPYREKGVYVTDVPFMNWLRYITQMLIETSKSTDKTDKKYKYLSIDTLSKVYEKKENLKFLIDSLDLIPKLKDCDINCSLEWDDKNTGLKSAINWLITDGESTDVMKQLCVFAAIKFLCKFPDGNGIGDFIRVIRNLIENTPDRSMREWPIMIESINKLISQDVYNLLATNTPSLTGFRVEQREIEIFKAKIIHKHPDSYSLICEMDSDSLMTAREGNLIIALHETKATNKFSLNLNQIDPEIIDLNRLRAIFNAYKKVRTYHNSDYFEGVWGEFIQTNLYQNNDNVCWWSYESNDDNYIDYANHPIVLRLVREVMDHNGDVEKVIISRQKRIIKQLLNKTNNNLQQLLKPKDQLYVLYVGTVSFLNKSYKDFFVDDRFNFGWVNAEQGYTTPFLSLINDSIHHQIFQAYSERFRSDCGISDHRTPWILKVNTRGKNFLQRLSDWANSPSNK